MRSRNLGLIGGIGLAGLMAATGKSDVMGGSFFPSIGEPHNAYRRLGGRARSKYRPHQGEQEAMRRRNQIRRGRLTASNGLVVEQ